MIVALMSNSIGSTATDRPVSFLDFSKGYNETVSQTLSPHEERILVEKHDWPISRFGFAQIAVKPRAARILSIRVLQS